MLSKKVYKFKLMANRSFFRRCQIKNQKEQIKLWSDTNKEWLAFQARFYTEIQTYFFNFLQSGNKTILIMSNPKIKIFYGLFLLNYELKIDIEEVIINFTKMFDIFFSVSVFLGSIYFKFCSWSLVFRYLFWPPHLKQQRQWSENKALKIVIWLKNVFHFFHCVNSFQGLTKNYQLMKILHQTNLTVQKVLIRD